jgi:hypothetical protein
MSNDLATQQPGGAVALYDYGQDKAVGFENVTNDDLSIPFLNILQSNSPEVAGEVSQRIKGAAAGMLINTVTNELYPEAGIIFQPVLKNHVFVEWKPRGAGGGYVAAHEQSSDIVAKAQAESKEFGKYKTPSGNDLVETIYFFGLIHRAENVNEQVNLGRGEPIIVTFQSTKIRPYKNMMYRLYTLAGKPPLFANRLRVKTVMENNNKGSFYNYNLTGAVNDDLSASLIPPSFTVDGQAAQPHPLLIAGKEFLKAIAAGLVKVNYGKMKGDGPAGGTEKGEDDIPF